MNTLLNIFIVLLVAWLIIRFFIPLLPGVFATIVLIVLVVSVIVWLMKLSGLWF